MNKSVAIVDGQRAEFGNGRSIAALTPSFAKGVFSTARVVGGELEWRELHRERLFNDAKTEGLNDVEIDLALSEASHLVRENVDGAMSRIIVGVDLSGRFRRIVTLEPLRRVPASHDDPLRKISLARDPRTLPVTKNINRALLVKHEIKAKVKGHFGVVLHGAEGVREGTFFHVFAKIAGQWVTPPVSVSVCQGVGRAAFMRSANVIEREFSVKELKAADAIYVTNALLGAARAVLV